MTGFIFASEFADDDTLASEPCKIYFPAFEPLISFFDSISTLFISCLVTEEACNQTQLTIYKTPLKNLFTEFLVNRSSPAPFT
jgi:hypothetical protein